ncbi:hypothetical protein DEJ51_00960 [Streptomyces venezuelae]|uniref:Uncharacterized protein n=1 Tax=Streptomyces venezuelae TaxID=54571 RepID=A0A5P2DD50_STRVZ|nr:hypothetical protein DEJ51_00960 [Streptomyces venezuelae]
MSPAVEQEEKPGWGLAVTLSAVLSLVLRLTEVRSWWALLWVPLFLLAVGCVTYEWRLTARSRWRMGPMEWVYLAVTHLGLLAALAKVLGFLPR